MLCTSLVALLLAVDFSPSEMSALRGQRSKALDRLVLNLEVRAGNAPSSEPFATSEWVMGPVMHHRITLAGSTFVDDVSWSMDGKAVSSYTIRDGKIVRKSNVAEPDGSARFSITAHPRWSDYQTAAGLALLQTFDLHLADSPEPWLSLNKLLESGRARLVASDVDRATYSACVGSNAVRQRYEFTINARGTPMLIKTQYEYLNDGKPAGSAEYEQHVLETTPVAGFELPTRTVFVSRNPAVANVPGMAGRAGVVEVRVTGWEFKPSLDPETVGERVQRRSSTVIETDANGARTTTKYGRSGEVLAINLRDPKDDELARATGPIWLRTLLLPGLAVASVAAAGAFVVSRRSRA